MKGRKREEKTKFQDAHLAWRAEEKEEGNTTSRSGERKSPLEAKKGKTLVQSRGLLLRAPPPYQDSCK